MPGTVLKVAGMTIRLQSDGGGLIHSFNEMYKHHLAEDGAPVDSTLTIKVEDMTKYINEPSLPFQNKDGIAACHYIYSSYYDPKSHDAFLVTSPHNAFSFVEEYLLVLTSFLALSQEKLLFHCAAIESENKDAYIFYGPSGIGKSTMAQNAGQRVISDDLVVLEPDKAFKEFRIHKTPFNRDKAPIEDDGRSYKINGFYRLHQSPESKIERIPESEAVLKFLGNIWNFYNSNQFFNNYLKLSKQILANTPSFDLYVKKGATFKELFL